MRTLVAGGVEAAVEEILRTDDPFVSNRRVATCPVDLGGRDVAQGDRVLLNWTAANRDPGSSATPTATTRPGTPTRTSSSASVPTSAPAGH